LSVCIRIKTAHAKMLGLDGKDLKTHKKQNEIIARLK
jgi:hypothetical protein